MNNTTHRIQPRVLSENVAKLDEMAEDKGNDRQEFMEKIVNERFIFPDEDTELLFKIVGLKFPFEDIKPMKQVEVTEWNTKRYSVEVTNKTERGLWLKAHKKSCTGRYAIADLLNKMCINGAMFIQEGTLDLIKSKRGGKK